LKLETIAKNILNPFTLTFLNWILKEYGLKWKKIYKTNFTSILSLQEKERKNHILPFFLRGETLELEDN